MFLFPVKKMQAMLKDAEPGFVFTRVDGKKRYKAEVEKDGTKKYSIHILKTVVNNKQYWFYDTYVLDPDTNDYVKDYSGRYPYSFTNR